MIAENTSRLRYVVNLPQFALLDLGLVLFSGVMWYLKPELGAWLLIIPLLPWIIRMLAGRFPFKRTYFDLLLLAFLLSAGVGLWAAYNPQAAQAKFWQIAASILLFYALAGQPKANLWIVCGIFSGLAALISIYFLLSYDFGAQPADIALLDRLARTWSSFRPGLPPLELNANMYGGIIAVLFPFTIAFGLLAHKRKNQGMVLLAVVFGSHRAGWAFVDQLARCVGCVGSGDCSVAALGNEPRAIRR